MPIAHLEAFYPYFLGNISKLASPLKQWVPGHPEVRWSRFVSSKKPCFRHNFWTETLISPIFTTSTPPLAIHGWKAMDLTVNLAPSYRDLKDPTSRQNFYDMLEQKVETCHWSETLSYLQYEPQSVSRFMIINLWMVLRGLAMDVKMAAARC